MADEKGYSWVFESLIEFLTGPVWEAAVLTFIERKSIVFEPNGGDEEEYKKLHKKYKNLVDTMLSNHMKDMGFTPEEFKNACSEIEKGSFSQYRKSLFQNLWAANDYKIFKHMMIQKNLELQLQVLDLLAYKYGLLPESVLPEEDYEPSTEEKAIMDIVMKRYLEENLEDPEALRQTDQKEILQAKIAQLEEERQKEKIIMDEAMESTIQGGPKTDEENPVEITTEETEAAVEDESQDDENPVEITTEISAQEAKRVHDYMKQLRDGLLAQKMEERENLLENFKNSDRPSSARAAQRMVADEMVEEDIDPIVVEYRKLLAAKLKGEGIEEDKTRQKSPYLDGLRDLSLDLSKLMDDDSNPDVQLVCGDNIVSAHRLILCARSEVFRTMLQNDIQEGREDSIEILDMEPKVFEIFIRYLYTGITPELKEHTAAPLYEAGGKYRLETLKSLCGDFLAENLTQENACRILVMADAHNDEDLKEEAMSYVLNEKIPKNAEEWSNFCKDHPDLANAVLNRAYQRSNSS